MKVVVFGYREDRWKRCKEILEKNEIPATRFKTRKYKDKYKEAGKDFRECIKQNRCDYLMFFEDDFELSEGWRDVLIKAWNDVPEFDLLYLGANLTTPATRITENLVKVNGAWCFHGVIISVRFQEYILRYWDYRKNPAFDDWIRWLATGRRFYMTYPMICYQRGGFSDFADRKISTDIFKNKYYLNV